MAHHQWSPEEIQAMRQKVQDGSTLKEVGHYYGVSRQRVGQIIGDAGRPPHWRTIKRWKDFQALVFRLTKSGMSDEQIAVAVDIPLSTVSSIRTEAGIFHRRHTEQSALLCIDIWYELYGFTPSPADWDSAQALKLGHAERVRRLVEFRAEHDLPHPRTIYNLFGSWSEYIRQSGLPKPPRGRAAYGRFSDAQPGGRPAVWTNEAIIDSAIAWLACYGSWPRPSDWNIYGPSKSKDVVTRHRDSGAPHYGSVLKYFGSFDAMLTQARRRLTSGESDA